MTTGIDHVAVYVQDIEAAKDFFVKYLNVSVGNFYHNPKTGFRSCFLSWSDGSRIEIMNRAELGESGARLRCGLNHIALRLQGKDDVDATTRRLSDDGYEVLSSPRTTGDGYYESCVAGPEGMLIELTM